MNIKLMGKPEIIMSNPHSKHGYFAWPTVALLQNGKIAVGASGFRIEHICPFGKAVISFSSDEGNTYTAPAPVIDTPLDDRDAGICTFGKSGIIFTSFNNSAEMQRQHNKDNVYVQSYIDTITPEDEEKYLGSLFRISYDYGKTFGEIFHSPVSSPHGPVELSNGTILWAGTNFSKGDGDIEIAELNTKTGETKIIGKITIDDEEALLCEPYVVELSDSKLICHIRGENGINDDLFTTYQSVSTDKGRTWSEPQMLLDKTGGAPPHLFRHSSGALISTYGRRKQPYGIMAMISLDDGKTWETDIRLYENTASDDIGYPSTIELNDGSLLTVFYAKEGDDSSACVIMQQRWAIE